MSKKQKKSSPQSAVPVQRNVVAKFARTYNKAHCFIDRKAALKRGEAKHKSKGVDLINLWQAAFA